MKHFLFFMAGFVPTAFFGLAYCQVDGMEVVETKQFLEFLVHSLGGLDGLGALAIAAFAVQALVMLLKTPLMHGVWNKVAGKWKILIVTGLSLIAGVISLVVSGVSIGAALVHSTTLSALAVFLNQIYQHVVPKKPAA